MLDVFDTVAERRQQVAAVTGTDELIAVRMEIGKLLETGLLIDLDLHGFSMLSTSVSWEELGMSPEDERRQRTTRGRKALVPKEYDNLASIETRLRTTLDSFSFSVSGFRPWRWLPFSAYQAWRERHDAIVAELEERKCEIIAHLAELVDANVAYFREVARRAWRSYHTPSDASVIKTPSGRFFAGYDAFESFIVDSALAEMPTADQIRHGIFVEYHTGYLLTDAEGAEIRARTVAAQAEESKAAAEAQRAWQAVEAEARAARQLEREREIELTQREMQARAVRQAEYEHARQQLSGIVSPIGEVVEQFRGQIFESVTKAAESIQTLGYVHGKTAEKLTSLRGLYDMIAGVTNDTELEEALDALQAAMQAPGAGEARYNLIAVENAIGAVADITSDAAYELRRKAEARSRSKFLEF